MSLFISAVKSYDKQKIVDSGRINRVLQEKAVLQLLQVIPPLL
jgi:hypothetical protein